MKQYKYVPLRLDRFVGINFDEHRKIIDEYAKNGFRYAGYIPTVITDYGRAVEVDLIFETDT